jgi:hypothetical protein
MSDETNKVSDALLGHVAEIPVSIDIETELQKPRLISLLFCDFVNETDDKKANVLGVFDRVYVHPDNNITPRFWLFLRTAETHKGRVNTTIIAPDNKTIEQLASYYTDEPVIASEIPVNLQGVIPIQFMARIEGVYWFDISYEGESLGGAGLVVEFRETETRQGGTDTYP